jgi:hypothetical protein
MTWPQGSWLVSKLLGEDGIQWVATALFVIVALGFAIGGLGLFLRVDWWRSVTAFAAVSSSILFLICWNGKFQALDDQGSIGVLINLAILVVTLVFNWPI